MRNREKFNSRVDEAKELPPVVQQNGKILYPPLGELRVVFLGAGKLGQMADASGHDVAATLQIAVHTDDRA